MPNRCSCIGGIIDPGCPDHGEQSIPEDATVQAIVRVEAIYPGMVILLVTTASGEVSRHTCAEGEGFSVETYEAPKFEE
jgi:hypothetical protein